MWSRATAEYIRLTESEKRTQHWRRWGPYLPERQWGTVREDYSPDGSCWDYFSYDVSRSRVYRWGEDGLLGWCDRRCRLCFSVSLWNGEDGHLKEKLFGLTGPQGNHGEDVKEVYYYLRALPTYAFAQAAYCYPHRAFPYEELLRQGSKRSQTEPELELHEIPGLFEEGYFDVQVVYAKGTPNDTLIELRVKNVASKEAALHLVPTIWFRNTWSWGREGEAFAPEPSMLALDNHSVRAVQDTLGSYIFSIDPTSADSQQFWTNNETNFQKLFGQEGATPYTKDAFHRHLVESDTEALSPHSSGTKMGFHLQLNLLPHEERVVRLRLCSEGEQPAESFSENFERTIALREEECSEFYRQVHHPSVQQQWCEISEQAYAGLLWSKQFYYYSVREWQEGDPTQPAPDKDRKGKRNAEWSHLYNMDVVSMPDKWEYPWYAAWDLAFHAVAFARVDPEFAKQQLLLLLREWYMHPNGQIPAYEFAFSDVNPPVHAWACWRVYKMTSPKGHRDRDFLEKAFHKLLINFTWWVNRQDVQGNNLFSGGFLGLDNIGVFDRSAPVPLGGHLEQSDATAWMAFYCGTMFSIALELSKEDKAYSDIASKFFEHFIVITDAINAFGGSGLWDETDGFYYDQLNLHGEAHPLRVRSLVGLIPLIAVEVIPDETIERLPGFHRRMNWLLKHRKDLARYITYLEHSGPEHYGNRLLALPSRERLEKILSYLLDENEFLSPFGIRSLSKFHRENPYSFDTAAVNGEGDKLTVAYTPGESDIGMFGGNSNWRGPVWFPTNYLIIEALEKYSYFYRDSLKVEFPTGSGNRLDLREVGIELSRRMIRLFEKDDEGNAPYLGKDPSPLFRDEHHRGRTLFHEYFHGDTGKGLGASHQTGWTALVALLIDKVARIEADDYGLTGRQLPLRSE